MRGSLQRFPHARGKVLAGQTTDASQTPKQSEQAVSLEFFRVASGATTRASRHLGYRDPRTAETDHESN